MHQKVKSNHKILTRIRYFSYSIPLACIMTLIGSLIFTQYEVYAADAGTCPVLGVVPDGYYLEPSLGCIVVPSLTPTESISIETSTTPTASLTIDGKTSVTDSINSSYGATNYASHTVSVNVTGAGSYDLILSGPAKLSGPSVINATSGATGANLANDTWGYAWENTNITNENANYKALGSSIKLTGDALNNQAASFSKKLAFAAKFDKATAGIYHADVSLSLVATPKITTTTVTAVPWDKLVYMQDMSNYACESVSTGTSKTLKDVRDNNTYTIAKLSDGKCWMTQNLRLSRDTLKSGLENTITEYDTNTDSKYTIPASTTGAFSNTKGDGTHYDNQQVRAATDNDYGADYSYNVATLNKYVTQDSGSVTYDICPKGWRLPTSGSNGEFKALADKYPTNYGSGLTWSTVNSKNGHWLGAASTAAGGAFFPAAGYMTTTASVQNPGSSGGYWSSTIGSATSAYYLVFGRSSLGPATNFARYYGFSVRCVAK